MSAEFLTAINVLSAEKGVAPEIVLEALESALVTAYKRNFGEINLNVTAKIDPVTGEARVYSERTVTEEPADASEVSLEEARGHKPDIEIGETLAEDVTPHSFGRIAAQTAKQHITQKLREAERKRVYDEFSERVGEILHGLVQRIEQKTVVMELGKSEAVMPPSEQVPTERYFPGQRLRVYLVDVHETHKGPQLLVSRAHKLMIRRLFEQEVPEIFNGIVEIKAIAREPGARSKVAVTAQQEGIDPVGSCVGMRGVRIQNIVTELNGEKVDVIPWDQDPAKFVASALSPAQVQRVDISEEDKTATVVVPERQLSLAIGREGQNARLAARLTGWRIDIKSDAALARAELENWAAGGTLGGDEPADGGVAVAQTDEEAVPATALSEESAGATAQTDEASAVAAARMDEDPVSTEPTAAAALEPAPTEAVQQSVDDASPLAEAATNPGEEKPEAPKKRKKAAEA
jgi:transcription termination/antitermination protein NusA